MRAWGVEIVRGDLTVHSSLPAACAGSETVVASATAIGRMLGGAKKPGIHEVDEIGTSALVEAAESAGVERFVYVSYAGVDASLGMPLERAKSAIESRLARSPMRRVVVQPDAFQDIHLAPMGRFDVQAGTASVFGRGDTERRWIATEDVAALVAAVALEADPPDTIAIGGPEAISRNEAVAIAETLTGRQFKVQRMPRALTRLGMRLLDRPSPAMASIFGLGLMFDVVEAAWDDTPLRERGITPRSTSAWLEEEAHLTR
jgi:uncharacterized protein YbjT (DUF2867 family)